MSAGEDTPAPFRPSFPSVTPFDAEGVKRRGYHDMGILVVSVCDDRLSDAERAALRAIAEKLYGRFP